MGLLWLVSCCRRERALFLHAGQWRPRQFASGAWCLLATALTQSRAWMQLSQEMAVMCSHLLAKDRCRLRPGIACAWLATSFNWKSVMEDICLQIRITRVSCVSCSQTCCAELLCQLQPSLLCSVCTCDFCPAPPTHLLTKFS